MGISSARFCSHHMSPAPCEKAARSGAPLGSGLRVCPPQNVEPGPAKQVAEILRWQAFALRRLALPQDDSGNFSLLGRGLRGWHGFEFFAQKGAGEEQGVKLGADQDDERDQVHPH